MKFWTWRGLQPKMGKAEAPSAPVNTSRFDRSRPLAFLHVPKTAGTAVVHALASVVPDDHAVTGFDRSIYGVFDDFDSMSAALRATIHLSPASFPREARLITGHIAYSTLRQAYPDAQIITVLRDPPSRLLSHWLFWRRHTDDMLAGNGGWTDFVRFSREPLASFLSEPLIAPHTDNMALRMILWPHPLIAPDGFIDPSHDEALLQEALARLKTFAFIDVIENDSFASNIELWLGRPMPLQRINETANLPHQHGAPLHRELSDAAYDLLTTRSRLDLRLWMTVAQQAMKGADAAAVQQRSMIRNIARYSAIMAA